MTTVVCVLRSGGNYDATWVSKLRDGVARNLGSHRFVCLSDLAVPCERIPLKHHWPGWWSKIEAFRPGLFAGPVLYMDLDVVATGGLDVLFREEFTMCDDFLRPGLKNSSVMAWTGEEQTHGIYWSMMLDPEGAMAVYKKTSDGRIGDQAFIEDHVNAETFQMGHIVSYKTRAKYGVPEGARAVAFHGQPKMDTAGGWVDEVW